jgi:hypothetical protein
MVSGCARSCPWGYGVDRQRRRRCPDLLRRRHRSTNRGVVTDGGQEDVQNVLFDVVGVDVKW